MSDHSSEWLEITYDQFWDVPRQFKVSDGKSIFLFVCDFDYDLDDYPPNYKVYRILETLNTAESVSRVLVGEIPVIEVEFDKTRRKEIKSAILEKLDGGKK